MQLVYRSVKHNKQSTHLNQSDNYNHRHLGKYRGQYFYFSLKSSTVNTSLVMYSYRGIKYSKQIICGGADLKS